mmetsp:Transcript_4086/g.10896  ORF Transcript_4086/g.10896 Transcript_4086/m.10896 type:complete len:149 (-) Transcript_4086:12-458(-)
MWPKAAVPLPEAASPSVLASQALGGSCHGSGDERASAAKPRLQLATASHRGGGVGDNASGHRCSDGDDGGTGAGRKVLAAAFAEAVVLGRAALLLALPASTGEDLRRRRAMLLTRHRGGREPAVAMSKVCSACPGAAHWVGSSQLSPH